MVDMKKLAGLIRELEDQLVVCMRCGMCQSVCPVFAETGREADVARGKLALLDGLIHEMFKDPGGVNERLSKCLLCGSCASNCPSGVRVMDVFLRARAILTGYMGLNPLKRAVFRGMLSRPEFFDGLLEWGSKLQGIFVKPVDDLLGTSCARFTSPLAHRHFKALASVPFHRTMESQRIQAGDSGLKVGFFVGCLIDKIFPDVAHAVMRAMNHHGVGVVVPDALGCCGIPALSSGDSNTFSNLVRYNLQRFRGEPVDAVITACATCTSTIKKLWPAMADGLSAEEQEEVKLFAEKTMDVSQFLVDEMGVGSEVSESRDQATVLTYHDPCHLKKSLGVGSQPRAVVKANPNYRLEEMVEPDRCCGCGGSFNLQYYDISASIGRRKRDSIVQTGCSVVATGCPACMLQISDMLSQSGDRVRVKHFMEIYVESLS